MTRSVSTTSRGKLHRLLFIDYYPSTTDTKALKRRSRQDFKPVSDKTIKQVEKLLNTSECSYKADK